MHEPLHWDLSDLYSSAEDPRYEADMEAALEGARAFETRWRGRLTEASGTELRTALTEFEELMRLTHRPYHFAFLSYSVATDQPDEQARYAAVQSFSAEVDQLVAFFSIELKDLDEEHLDALSDAEAIASYRHYIRYQKLFAAYTLSEDAERTISRKNVTGKSAWVNLYTQVTSALQYRVEVEGKELLLSRGDLGPYRISPERDLREQAAQSVVDAFEPHRDVLTFVFNTLFEDHRLDLELRGYDDVMAYTVLRDDLTPAIVEGLLETTSANFGTVHRYHRLRREVLQLPDYGTQDTSIPAFGDEAQLAWPEAQQLVLDAYERFSPQAAELARFFVDKHWIDVFPRKGKNSGAFCAPGLPPSHPWVMMNYSGTLNDVFTLAHELGHGIHGMLARAQSPLNFSTSKALAETASIFAELWLHEELMCRADSDAVRRQLLDRQIRDAVHAAFQQVAHVNWERRVHIERREGALSAERFSEVWLEEAARTGGPDLLLKERDSWRWITIPHFIFARFYCYSYAFGKLLTLTLHSLWTEHGDAFTKDYLALLAAGGSETPVELLSRMGLDLEASSFWQRGLDVVDGYMTELESLT